MGIKEFVYKHHSVNASLHRMAKNAVSELNGRLNQTDRGRPYHIASQKDLIDKAFSTDETVWLFFFDAGRYDYFDQLVWDYFDGNLQRAWNGGVGYTGDWTVRHLTSDFGERGLFSYVPLRSLKDADYNGREHFEIAPDIRQEVSVHERLAELGYRERKTDEEIHIGPMQINQAVRKHKEDLNGGVIRYLAPHPPFDGLEDITSESTKTMKTQQALDNGTLTYPELSDAYKDTYLKAFNAAKQLIPELDGTIYITSDHGTCLTCGQLFHGRRLEMHDHLTIVPWFELDRIL